MPKCKICGNDTKVDQGGLCEICRFEQDKIKEVNDEGYKSNAGPSKMIDPNKLRTAKIIVVIGSILGLFYGLYNISSYMGYSNPYMPGYGEMMVMLGLIGLIGNFISLMGVIMINNDPFKAKTIIIIGSIVAGLNLITLIGGLQIKKPF